MDVVTEQQYVGKSEINNIFDLPPTQIAIQDGSYITHKSHEISDEHSIVFEITVDSNHYADLSKSYMTFNAKIDGASATVVQGAAPNKVGPVNLWGHSIFNQIKVTLNDEPVTLSSNNMYPYEAVISTLLSYGKDAKETHLAVAGFAPDEAGKMEDYDPTNADGNEGLLTRASGINTGRMTDLLIRPHVNLFQQERLLPPGTKIGITMLLSQHNFNLMGDASGNSKYKTVITNPKFHLRRVELSKTAEMSHITEQIKNGSMRYPIRELKSHARTIQQGTAQYEQDIYTKVIPRRIWIAMVRQDARAGNYKLNPFNFQHFNMKSIQLNVAGKQVPAEELKVDFDSNRYKELYFNLFSQMDNMFDDRGNGISYSDFKDGFCIMAFDLTADMEDGEHLELTKRGNVGLKIEFKQPTARNISLIHIAEFENIISIAGSEQTVSRTWTQGS